eukprot:163583_1
MEHPDQNGLMTISGPVWDEIEQNQNGLMTISGPVWDEIEQKWSSIEVCRSETALFLKSTTNERGGVKLLVATPTMFYERWGKAYQALLCYNFHQGFFPIKCEQDSTVAASMVPMEPTFINAATVKPQRTESNSKSFDSICIPEAQKDQALMKCAPIRGMRADCMTKFSLSDKSIPGEEEVFTAVNACGFKWWDATRDISTFGFADLEARREGDTVDVGQFRVSFDGPAVDGKTPNSLRFQIARSPGRPSVSYTAFGTFAKFRNIVGAIFTGHRLHLYGDRESSEMSYRIESGSNGGYVIPIMNKLWMRDPLKSGVGNLEQSMLELKNCLKQAPVGTKKEIQSTELRIIKPIGEYNGEMAVIITQPLSVGPERRVQGDLPKLVVYFDTEDWELAKEKKTIKVKIVGKSVFDDEEGEKIPKFNVAAIHE